MRMVMKFSALSACLGALMLLVGCGRGGAGGDETKPMFSDDHGLLTVPADSPLRAHLAVDAVGLGPSTRVIESPAVVEADPARVANILTPTAGRVVALKVGIGQHVRRGQALAVMASGDFDQARADVAKADDGLSLASQALDRAKGVRAAGGAADKDLEAAQSAYNQAEAEQARAAARLASLSGGARELVLTAPQDGVLTTLSVAPGAQVSDPTAVLMTVTNIDRVFVTANVAEGQADGVAAGQSVQIRLTALPGQILTGRISAASALLEPDTRRRKVRIALDNPAGRLLPNMYGTVSIAAQAPTAPVLAPQSALLMNNDSVTVFVEVRPWVFQRRAVKIGDETDTQAEVVSGLQPGERVVVRGGVLLND